MRRVWKRTGPWAKVTTAVVVLALAGFGVWWFGFRGDDAAAATPTTRTVQASTTTMEKTVSGTGTVSPAVEDDVSFAVSGTVTGVSVTQGQTVTAGQVLGTLDTLPLQAADLKAKSDLATAQATLSNAQDASDGSAASTAKIAAAQSQVEVAQASVTTADANLAATTLTAPVAGLLTSVNVATGDAVTGAATTSGSSSSSSSSSSSQGGFGGGGGSTSSSSSSSSSSSAPFVIVGTDSWQVVVDVSDTDIANVKAGDQAEITIQDATDTIYGTVSTIGLLSTSSSGVAAYPVTIAITPGQSGLHDGESATVKVIYSKRTDVLAVPSLAVTTDANGNSVVTKVDAEGKQSKVVVKTGETSGQMTEITSGLQSGDSVVLQIFTPGTGSSNRTGQNGQNGQRGEGGFGGQFPGGGEFRNFQGGGNGGTGQGGNRG